MKKRLIMLAFTAVALSSLPANSYGQGFLRNLREKAENALIDAILPSQKNEEAQPTQNTRAQELQRAVQEPETPTTPPTAEDRIPTLHQSSVVWYGEATPSRASSARALLAELPALPSVNDVVNPDQDRYDSYYNKLTSINLRVNELDEEWACSDEEMLAARDKLYNELSGMMGLTAEEMKRLDDPNISEEEKARLEAKVQAAVLGGFDPEAMSRKAEELQPRLEVISAELQPLTEKAEKGTITPAEQARMMELSQESMALSAELMGGMGGLGNAFAMATRMTQATTSMLSGSTELEQQLSRFSARLQGVAQSEQGIVKDCEQIAAEYEDDLRAIYNKVHEEADNASEVHRLYDQADELMKNYRTRAANIFLAGLQVRLDNAKSMIDEAESLYAAMADNELIPACATRRAPLNVVTSCVDILNEAYSDFPQPTVSPIKREVVAITNLMKPTDRIHYGESGFAGGFTTSGGDLAEEFVNNSHLLVYDSEENCYVEITGGQRKRLDGYGPFNFSGTVERQAEAYGEIALRGGNRTAHYTRGGALTLHDGTMYWPLLMQKNSDSIEFIIYEYNDMSSRYEFVKCTYIL